MKPRAVLDTNVIVGSFAASRGALFGIAQAWTDARFHAVISDHLLRECRIAWSKPYWTQRITPQQIDELLGIIARRAELVTPTQNVVGIATHFEDDIVIATAVAGDTRYLVTGDKELLEIARYQSVEIIAPAEFLEILAADTAES